MALQSYSMRAPEHPSRSRSGNNTRYMAIRVAGEGPHGGVFPSVAGTPPPSSSR